MPITVRLIKNACFFRVMTRMKLVVAAIILNKYYVHTQIMINSSEKISYNYFTIFSIVFEKTSVHPVNSADMYVAWYEYKMEDLSLRGQNILLYDLHKQRYLNQRNLIHQCLPRKLYWDFYYSIKLLLGKHLCMMR